MGKHKFIILVALFACIFGIVYGYYFIYFDKSNLDIFSQNKKVRVIDKFLFVKGEQSQFYNGCLTSESKSYFVKDECLIFEDERLTKPLKISIHLLDSLIVLRNINKPQNTFGVERNVLEILIFKNNKKIKCYTNEINVAINTTILSDGNILITSFAEQSIKSDKQPILISIFNIHKKLILRKLIWAYGFNHSTNGKDSYEYNINIVRDKICSSLSKFSDIFNLEFTYAACGYENSKYKLFYKSNQLFISPELNYMSDLDEIHYSFNLITPCDNDSLSNNEFILRYYLLKSKDTAFVPNKRFFDNSKIDVSVKLDDKVGFILGDTIEIKKWVTTENL